jgi:CspA family cold shock protein
MGVIEESGGPAGRHMTGTVKWFDPVKGFGFIVADAGGPDILLHVNVLRNFGQNSISDGAEIEVLVHETARGLQAAEVLRINAVVETAQPGMEELGDLTQQQIAELPLEPARVKWFDKLKGFGFANVFGREQDVFLHIEVLRRSGFAEVGPGEAVALRVMDGRRGHMAVQVAPWEAALVARA